MFNVSNYSAQSQNLPAQNEFQLIILQAADASTFIRESSKCVTVVSAVISAASLIFNFDTIIPLTCTVTSGIFWLASGICAKKLEPEAKKMIKHFKNLKKENYLCERPLRGVELIA